MSRDSSDALEDLRYRREKVNMGDNSDLAGANPMGEMLNFEEKDAFAEVNTAAGLGSTNKVS